MAYLGALYRHYPDLNLYNPEEDFPYILPSDNTIKQEGFPADANDPFLTDGTTPPPETLPGSGNLTELLPPYCDYDVGTNFDYLSTSSSQSVSNQVSENIEPFSSSQDFSDFSDLLSVSDDQLAESGLPYTSTLQVDNDAAWWNSMSSQTSQLQNTRGQFAFTTSAQQQAADINYPTTVQTNSMEEDPLFTFNFDSSFDISTVADPLFCSPSPTPNIVPTLDQDDNLSNTFDTYPDYFNLPPQYQDSLLPTFPPLVADMPTTTRTSPTSQSIQPLRRSPRTRKQPAMTNTGPKPAPKAPTNTKRGPNNKNRTNSGQGVSFVNFTANDSRKLLGGVAPSGSSKTKARREKEAREKRQRIGEVALNAIQKAGGDIGLLEAAFW